MRYYTRIEYRNNLYHVAFSDVAYFEQDPTDNKVYKVYHDGRKLSDDEFWIKESCIHEIPKHIVEMLMVTGWEYSSTPGPIWQAYEQWKNGNFEPSTQTNTKTEIPAAVDNTAKRRDDILREIFG